MDFYFSELAKLDLQSWEGTHAYLKLLRAKDTDKIYIGIFKDAKYKDRSTGENKESNSRVLFTVKTAEALLEKLSLVLLTARLSDNV